MPKPVELVIRPRTRDLGGFKVAGMGLLGGAPIDGERYLCWNVVPSSNEQHEQAKDERKNNRFDRIAGDDKFIPLPEK